MLPVELVDLVKGGEVGRVADATSSLRIGVWHTPAPLLPREKALAPIVVFEAAVIGRTSKAFGPAGRPRQTCAKTVQRCGLAAPMDRTTRPPSRDPWKTQKATWMRLITTLSL